MRDSSGYILGFDVSTKTCGVTLMDLTGKLIDMDYISFPKKSKKNGNVTIYQKVDFFAQAVEKYKSYNIKHIFIEEPLKNGPNIGTTILLAKFNGMLSQKLYEFFGLEPEHITVYESRFIFFPEYVVKKMVKKKKEKIEVEEITLSFPKDADKKQLVFDKVSWLEPQMVWAYNKHFNIKEENYDMGDSYVVARAGLTINNYVGLITGYEPK